MKETVKEGLYFGMPEEEYHALPYLSRSMMEDIYTDVEEAWYKSHFNPNKPEQEPTKAMELGTAIHSAVLEPNIFDELYCEKPSEEDFEDKLILKSTDDLKNFLDSLGEKKTGVKKDLIERALEYVDPKKVIIWDNVQKEFNDNINLNGKRALSGECSEIIQGVREAVKRRPEIQDLLSKGYPEVTIIWKDEESGIMCKCRLDYVRPEAIGELKSFSLKGKQSVYNACCKAIVYEKYNLQFVVYSKALQHIIEKIRLGKAEVYGEVDKEWLNKFLESPKKQFYIIFVRTAQPFQAIIIELFKNSGGGSDNCYYSEPHIWFRAAIKKFKEMRQKFGDGRWIEKDCVKKLDDIHVSGVQFQYLQQK